MNFNHVQLVNGGGKNSTKTKRKLFPNKALAKILSIVDFYYQ